MAGFLPTQALKEAIPALNRYIQDTQEAWDQHGMRVKGFDVYFSRNSGFLWVDTLYNESNVEAHAYGYHGFTTLPQTKLAAALLACDEISGIFYHAQAGHFLPAYAGFEGQPGS